ncbi:MAG: glycosyl hydrolase family 18 protein [Candidatus Dormibacter sp.]
MRVAIAATVAVLATFAAGSPVSALPPSSAPVSAVVQHDPAIGPHLRDEARHPPDTLRLTPLHTAIIPRQSVKAPMVPSNGSSSGALAPATVPGTTGTLQREVFGFAPSWTIGGSTGEISWNYSLLSTVAYFGLTINADGSINQSDQGWTGWNSNELADLINRAHGAGDRVVLVIKATNAATVNAIVTDQTATTAAITNAIAKAQSKNLDGINVDLEGQGAPTYPDAQAGFTRFMQQLHTQVPAGWQVTADTYSGSASWNDGIFRIDYLAPYVDAFFVMAYDMNFDNLPGHAAPTAPLNGWTYNDTTSVQQYLAKTNDRNKVILGVPYYGYKWCTTSGNPLATTQACPDGAKSPLADTYSDALQDLNCGPNGHPNSLAVGWDNTAQSPWASWSSPAAPNDPCGGNHNSWRELYDENGASLALKYDLVNNNNLRGTGMWALGFDGSSQDLWDVLYAKFGPWRSWQSLGGQLTSSPDVASWGSNRLDVFARGTDNALWHKWWDGRAWSAWELQGGQIASDPAAVSWGINRIDVFARGTNNALLHRWWDGRAWSGWESLGGILSSGPDVASWGSGRLDVFVRGIDNAIWHKWWDGRAWGPWERLGGAVNSDPSAVSSGVNHIDLFYRAGDLTLWHRAWNGSSWNDGESLGGILTTGPDASSWGSGRLDVFVRGSDNALWHLGFDGTSWLPWQRLGGAPTSDPAAVSWGPGRIDTFTRGPDNALWHIWYQSG